MRRKVVLQDAFKHFTLDQDKTLAPEETVRRFKEKLRQVKLDLLEETVRIDTGRLGIPVFFSVCGRDARNTIGTKKQMGKGATAHQSEASAVMELAERFSFFSFVKSAGNFFIQDYRNLKDKAISFDLIARSVHDDSGDLDKARAVFSALPLKWTWAYNLTTREEVLIPFNWFFAINEFNGPSAGNCVEEALLQGICEIVERHVSSVISRDRIRRPGIKLASATDPVVLEMIGKYRKAGVRLYASDFSLDTGIPTVGLLAYDPSTFPQRSEIVWTAGTTPSAEKALSRALTEVAQLAGDFNTGSNYVASGLPKFTGLSQADFVTAPDRTIQLSELPDLSDDNIRIEVENCLAALARIGLEVIVVDVTDSRLGIPAYYTIVPGAHFRERAAGTSVGMFCAKLTAENREPERAIEGLMTMDRLMPGKYYVKFFLGSCHLAANQPTEALACFEQALHLDPKPEDVATIYSYMGQCLKALERYKDAISILEKAESYDKERTDIYNLMGFCHFSLKDYEKAIACFKQVLALDPSSAIDYANIASNYREMGRTDLAVRYYQLALELDPSIEFARDNLRKLEQKTGR